MFMSCQSYQINLKFLYSKVWVRARTNRMLHDGNLMVCKRQDLRKSRQLEARAENIEWWVLAHDQSNPQIPSNMDWRLHIHVFGPSQRVSYSRQVQTQKCNPYGWSRKGDSGCLANGGLPRSNHALDVRIAEGIESGSIDLHLCLWQ